MPEHGGELHLGLWSSASDGRALVSVEDNGHGIASEHVAHIFTPFFTTKVEGKGTGLGLAIVKNILSDHRADIHVERGQRGGARFVLSFPLDGVDAHRRNV